MKPKNTICLWYDKDALDAAQFFNVALFHGDDLREGAEAFLDKRPPRWAEPDA